jgi:glycosyltransferase involved in cell wall biosynthesis
MRVALIHDWLDTWGGGESVLVELARAFPGSDVFTLVDFLAPAERERIAAARVHTSPIARLPGARAWFRYAAVLWPSLIERFDVTGYDVILSDSHAIAKGVRKSPGQLHVCYCHTPARFAWTMEETYAERSAAGARWRHALARALLARFRRWDLRASTRVDRFIANSRHIAAAIERCYGRTSDVVYPPVDTERFADAAANVAGTRQQGVYVTVSRLVPYKRIDVIVDAFRELPERRLVVIGDGPDFGALAARRPPNVELAGRLDNAATAARVAAARAFLFAAEEDFGIAPVEAQAAGLPVIAYGRGGIRETIRGLDDVAPTGVFFDAQTPQALAAAVRTFEANDARISAAACRANAQRFSPARFRDEIQAIVAAAFERRARGRELARV